MKDYISASCNRVPHVLDWGKNGILAYGSSHAVVLAKLESPGSVQDCILHIHNVLNAHTSRVNCVRWLKHSPNTCLPNEEKQNSEDVLISTGADKKSVLWEKSADSELEFQEKATLTGEGVGDLVDGLRTQNGLWVVTGLDAKASVWFSSTGLPSDLKLEQTLNFGSSFILDLRLCELNGVTSPIMAFGCSDSKVHLYGFKNGFQKLVSLTGHEDWVRGLDFTTDENGDVLLASCSHDSYVRLWRISHLKKQQVGSDNFLMSNHSLFQLPGDNEAEISFAVSLDSVLSGHENWVYGVRWEPRSKHNPPRLLTCSMDKTMILWNYDKDAQLWLDHVRVGEVGGNALGFYGNSFAPSGETILAHGFNGAFHLWTCNENEWEPGVSCGGHFGEVVNLAWSPTGSYLLSTSTDQTTRLHAPWVRDGKSVTWHEIARPQVHGYDLSCLTMIDKYRFASGAEEKVIRVFQAPTNFLENFERLSLVKETPETISAAPQGASVPALGLSNKPVYESDAISASQTKNDQYPETSFTPTVLTRPPTEETLLQYTLWPEIHKLYGHGNELFALACDPAGQLLVSASKAAQQQGAAIMVWDTESWTKIGALEGHVLTVTQMAFAPNGEYLLSVSRDRTWVLYARQSDNNRPNLVPVGRTRVGSKVHSRIIWSCDWSPDSRYFATGSRDKKLVIWDVEAVLKPTQEDEGVAAQQTLDQPITAVAFAPILAPGQYYYIAVGFENGTLALYKWSSQEFQLIEKFSQSQSHHMSVKRIQFRPMQHQSSLNDGPSRLTMATAGADGFVRIHNLTLPPN